MQSFEESINECMLVIYSLRTLSNVLRSSADCCGAALSRGGKLLICGNGGSAAQAGHLTGELMGRYKNDRPGLAAVTLGPDSTVVTCIANDFRFEDVFSRQIRALGRAGDVLIVFTTSGQSPNILEALKAAREIGLESISFLGRRGSSAAAFSDYALLVSHDDTARIQEGHQLLMHCLMDRIESGLTGRESA
jgi:D-sedoheptulose 7-phosphate isomerase